MKLALLLFAIAAVTARADFALGSKKKNKVIAKPIPSKVDRLVGQIKPKVGSLVAPVPVAIPAAETQATPAPVSSAPETPPVVSSAPASPNIGGTPGTSSAGNQITYDENAPRGKGEGQGAAKAAGGAAGGSKNVVAYDKWWPMCVFIDPAVQNGNEVVREMVRMAADECKVNLVVFPFYVKGGYSRDANTLKNTARKKCNAQDGFRKFGVNRASIAVLTGDTNLPNKMCGRNGGSETACGEMGWGQGQGIEQRMRSTGRWGGVAPPGQGAVAIIGPKRNGMIDPAEAAGAAQGQAQMSRPPGYGGGNGMGDVEEGQAGGGSGSERGWSSSGCQAMRAASFPNDGKWKFNPKQEEYVMKDKNESHLFDLASAKPIFGEPPGPPKSGGGGGGGQGEGGGASAGGAAAGPATTSLASSEDSDAGHKKAPGSGGNGGGEGAARAAGLRSGGADKRALYGGASNGAESQGESATSGEGKDTGAQQNLIDNEAANRGSGEGVGQGASAAGAASSRFGYGPKGEGALGGSNILILGKPIQSATPFKGSLDGDFFKQAAAQSAEEAKREPGAALRKSGATEYAPSARKPERSVASDPN